MTRGESNSSSNNFARRLSFEGLGTLKASTITLSGQVHVSVRHDGRMYAELRRDDPPYELFPSVGKDVTLHVELPNGRLEVPTAFLLTVGRSAQCRVGRLLVRDNDRKLGSGEFSYLLANCVFKVGSHVTENGSGGGSWNAIEVTVNGVTLRATTFENYEELIDSAKRERTSAITAELRITGARCKADADSLADGFCDLLTFASKNTVRWVARESAADKGTETEFIGPLLYPLRTSWSLIPDVPVNGEHQLHKFLDSVLPRYAELEEQLGLRTTIGWLLESEMSTPVQAKFLFAFAAIERVRGRLLKGKKASYLLHPNFNDFVDGPLGDQLVASISDAVGGIDDSLRKILRRKLKDLNRPSISAALDALCELLAIEASTAKMSHLRSRLVHAGDLGEFDFADALDLYWELSHLLDVCLLKALGFNGYYHHLRTDWQDRLVDNAFLSAREVSA